MKNFKISSAFKLFILGLCLASATVPLAACEQESALEESAEEMGDEIEDATD